MKSFSLLFTCVLFLMAGVSEAASRPKKDTLEELSRDAYIWGYPAVFMKQIKKAMLTSSETQDLSPNHYYQSSESPEAFLGHFLSVNPENLYGWAWVDLTKGPLILTHPQIVDRFYSIQFVDAFSNVFQTVSNRSFGEKSGNFVLIPPGWKGTLPEGTTPIRASTPEILIFAQTFVQNPKDSQEVYKTLKQRKLLTLSEWNSGMQRTIYKQSYSSKYPSLYPTKTLQIKKNLATEGPNFYKELSQILKKNAAPSKSEEQELERFSKLGLNDPRALEKFLANSENQKAMERGLFEGERSIQARLATGFGTKINGWSYELKTPAFSEDYLLRAAVSQRHLFSPPAIETMQMTLEVDSESRQLFSNFRYVLHFEKEDFPPARNMWSLKIHEMKNRSMDEPSPVIASLNDRTAKLKINMDGSVDILLQSEKPSASQRTNWIPLSKNANFYVVLTIYNPSNTALNRKYIAPSLTRLDEDKPPKRRLTQTMIAWQEVSK